MTTGTPSNGNETLRERLRSFREDVVEPGFKSVEKQIDRLDTKIGDLTTHVNDGNEKRDIRIAAVEANWTLLLRLCAAAGTGVVLTAAVASIARNFGVI